MKQFKTIKKKKTINYKTKDKNIKAKQIENPDKDGMYPIHIAIQNNDLGTLELLITNGADLNKYNRDGDTPILLAVKDNNPQIVEKLLEEGVDLKRADTNKNFPLSVAINLDNQECIDLLTEHETSSKKTSAPGTTDVQDRSADFVDKLIKLLSKEIISIDIPKNANPITQKILLLLQQYLDLKKIPKNSTTKLIADVNYRISQFLPFLENNIKIENKDVLNLSRKIIVIIQDCKKNLSTNLTWTLNRIESLIEEKIVNSNGESKKTLAHVFIPNNSTKKESSTFKGSNEDWYTQNGYKNFNEFIRINNSGAGHIKFLKFSNIHKENFLRKTSNRGTETLEITTIKPLHPTTNEEFLLLISNAAKRIKEEQLLLNHSPTELEAFNKLLHKAKNETELSIDESLQLDKILRPGKKNKIHLVHFHHTNSYEPFWNDLTKEAFLTGTTIHLFNTRPEAMKVDLIYSGIAIINKLLDEGVHPDKIILQSYGNGHLISKEVRNQFQKRGIDLTQINYQHSLFNPTTYPDFICDYRNLNICTHNISNKKILRKENDLCEFSKSAEHIINNLEKITQDIKCPDLTAVLSENYSLPQIINTFIATSQNFLKRYLCYKNPPLPNERVENIFGVINV
jgi:ankyrin repeat protein